MNHDAGKTPYTILEINIRTPNHHYSSQTTKTNSKMKEDQQTMTKYLPFKTKRRSVAQTVFIWQRFEEKLSFYQNHILRFSVQIFKGQPMLKVLLNLNGLTKIILLGLIRSHFLLIFWLLKKLKAAVKHIALKSSNINIKPNQLNHFFGACWELKDTPI